MPSRYSLVIAVAKRAKQIREGAPKLVESRSKNPITIALEEIAAGKVDVVIPTQAEIEAASRRQELVPERPRARGAADLLRVPETYESDLEDGEPEGSFDAEPGDQSDDSDILADGSDDEIVVEPSEIALETLESEE